MKRGIAAFFILVVACAQALAQTVITGDAWTTGRLGVGTSTPTASMEVIENSSVAAAGGAAFQVSGVDETPFFQVSSGATVGLGLAPQAGLDVSGSGDSGNQSLELDNGNASAANSQIQIAFGANGTTDLSDALRTLHSTSAATGSMDFLVWTPSVSTTSVGTLDVASLVQTSTCSSLHIMPVGQPNVELEVSNGVSTGGGTVVRASEGTYSSREYKTDISYLTTADYAQAYEDVRALNPVWFRYKRLKGKELVRDTRQAMRRGYIYEDAPASIKGTGGGIVIDERLVNAEMAAQELARRLSALETQAAKLQNP